VRFRFFEFQLLHQSSIGILTSCWVFILLMIIATVFYSVVFKLCCGVVGGACVFALLSFVVIVDCLW